MPDTPMDPVSGSEAPNDAQGAVPTRQRRLPLGLRLLLWVFALLIGLPLAAATVLLATAFFFRSEPGAHMPQGFSAYASLPSASAFINEALHLKALDAALSSPESAALRASVRTLRANPALRSPAFLKLADIRVDAALYDEGNFLLAADLGLRSALTRLLPLALRLFPSLPDRVEGLAWEEVEGQGTFSFESQGFKAFGRFYRNILVISSSPELLETASRPGAVKDRVALAKALGSRGMGSLRFLADPNAFVGDASAKDDPLGRLLSGLSFNALSVVDLGLKDERVTLSAELPFTVKETALKALLTRRSSTPAILTRLPESTVYFSLLSAGSPSLLWEAAYGLLGSDTAAAYKTADDASRLAFGMGLDKLLFSWMGDEMGVLGSDKGPSPVFFASVRDERARKQVFDQAFGSLLLGRDISAVVDGTRVPRVIFPRWLRNFLESLGVSLVEPFYLVNDGVLYAGASAELVAACVADVRAGKLLVKTERWKDTAASISAEASAMLYYDLDRSMPFFLRGQAGLSQALRLYRKGLASLKISDGALRVELSALASPSEALGELPGFPIKAPGSMDSDILAGRSASAAPIAYWTSGRSVISLNLSSGAFGELKLDDRAYVALDAPGGSIAAVWAVSAQGTVYRCDADLKPAGGFPLLTGNVVSAQPAITPRGLAVPISGETGMMFVSADGSTGYSAALGARLRTPPAVAPWGYAALPRSFDSELYLLDANGAAQPGWPVALGGIAGAAPLIAGAESMANATIAALTEEGELWAFSIDGAARAGFPSRLYGVFDSGFAWAPLWRSFFLVSAEGTLYRVSPDGVLLGSVPLKRGAAAGSLVLARDESGDGREEIYVAGGGDALYAYGGDLAVLEGFPVSGAGLPAFIDIDGDGRRELVVRGIDHSVHAYAQR